MRIAVCDNRIDALHNTGNILQCVCRRKKISAYIKLFSSTQGLLDMFDNDEYSFDFVLLYIGMKNPSSAECARCMRKLNSSFKLVFITSCETDIYDLFKYQISSVIPEIMPEEYMISEFERILEDINSKNEKYLSFAIKETPNTFAERKIPVSDIVYFTVSERIIYLRTARNQYTLKQRNFMELKNLMANYNFVEISRSCMVNIEYVRFIEENKLVLDNGIVLKISRRQIKNVSDAFSDAYDMGAFRKRA